MRTRLTIFALAFFATAATASARPPPPSVLAVKISDPEAGAIDLAFRKSPYRRLQNQPAYLLIPDDYAGANAHLRGGDTATGPDRLRKNRHTYALAIAIADSSRKRDKPRFAVVGFRPVPPPLEPDTRLARPKEPSAAELLRRLLAAIVVMQVDEKPPNAVPAADPNCPGDIPDTADAIKKTRERFGKNTYKQELAPGRKQGKWAHDPANNRIARGQTLPFYKVVLGVGCEKVEGKEQWGVGLISLDVQIRLVLGPGAKNHPSADEGATPGGLEGALGHETKHGDTIGEALDAELGEGKWSGMNSGLRDALDEMQKKRFATKAEAEAAKKKWQKLLEERLAKLVHASGILHTDKKGETAPRDGSAEVLDKEKNKITDETKLDDWIKEVKQLQTDGYTSYVKPGLFGKYP